MKILSMTATFGKLDHQTITMQPGLQVIHAPNEWGKSTWCAFIVAMLYGISTSSRTKKDFLADKERYAPWCGKPMSGRMEISWQGRNITIERSAKGKIPFGNFRAYETESNVDIPELTAENCGSVLLGVEREVFTRAGFLRGSDLPVVEDEALRRRLNALVTTGDESAAGDALAQKLKNLKNECRHNKTGMIPQAESRRDQLQAKLDQLTQLKEQTSRLQAQEAETAAYAAQLQNHQMALAYEKSLQTQEHVEKAEQALATATAQLEQLQEQCRDLPTQQTVQQELERLQQLQTQMLQLQQEQTQLPAMPQKPETPAPFAGKDPRQALEQASGHSNAYKMLCKPVSPILPILAGLLVLVSLVGLAFTKWFVCLPVLAVGLALGCVWLLNKNKRGKAGKTIADHYGSEDPDSWVALANSYADAMASYEKAMAEYETQNAGYYARKTGLERTEQMLTGGKGIAQSVAQQQQALTLLGRLEEAKRVQTQAKSHADTVRSLVQTAPKPEQPDTLTLSQAQTEQALLQAAYDQKQLHQRLGQCQGQMEALGDKGAMEQELEQVLARLGKLEEYNAALTLALETLAQATTELQRRFAPRISARARELFGRLTGGRYDRLLLASDLSMEVAATDEDTTHGVLWRSDGTMDQLYLALRLAVAEELTPNAPLVLDDAFARFDDQRMAAAMEILKEYAKDKQVILFTCHTREKEWEA